MEIREEVNMNMDGNSGAFNRSPGIPYFPFDVHLDDKFELIEAEFGITGFGVVVKLYQKIYGGQGYYVEFTKDVALVFARAIGLGASAVSEIVSACIRRGIFDRDIFEKYSILTSRGIQKRYFEAVCRRKNIEVEKRYLLFDVRKKYKNVNILDENVNISSENVNIFEHSKEKNRIVKNSKEEDEPVPPETRLYVPEMEQVVKLYQDNIAPITPFVYESMLDYLKTVDASLIMYAIREATSNNKRSFRYIQAILNRCINENLLNEEQATASRTKPDGKEVSTTMAPTDDIDEIETMFRKQYSGK